MESHSGVRALTLLSIVAPVYDEQDTIAEFCERVSDALAQISHELVLVDDGSTDSTPSIIAGLAQENKAIKVVHLSRNFGHQAALTAGLEHARGDAICMLDSDLQDPPEVITKLVEEWRRGTDVVYAVRSNREGETRFKLASADLFYKLFRRLANIDLPVNAGDFRLLDRRALDALLQMDERNRFLRGMTIWIGFRQTAVPYERSARHAGETKYPLGKMTRFSLDAIMSFSSRPLQLATAMGFLCSTIALLVLPLVVVARILQLFSPGIPTVLAVVLLIGGVQLISIGIIGEYVARVYDEVKRRPLYLVSKRRNMDDQ